MHCMRFWALCVTMPLWLMTGCRATPGFTWQMGFTQPPTIVESHPVSPLPAQPSTYYAVEEVQQWPHMMRSPQACRMPTAVLPAPTYVPQADPCAPQQAMPNDPCAPASGFMTQPARSMPMPKRADAPSP